MTEDKTRVGTVEWGNTVDSGSILRMEPTGFSDRLDIGGGDDAMSFTLSN